VIALRPGRRPNPRATTIETTAPKGEGEDDESALSHAIRIFVACPLLPEDEVLALAPAVEELGFDGIALADHVFVPDLAAGAYPYSSDGEPPFRRDSPWPDVFVLAGALGQVTTRLRVLTTIFVLPLRHPLLAAKAAATAARLSQGRLMLGVGAGWQRAEFEVLGIDYSTRDRRTDDAIRALQALWQEGPVTYNGEFFSFGPLLFEPTPPPIPILVGGASDAAIRRAAQLADGYILPPPPSTGKAAIDVLSHTVKDALERLSTALAATERDPADFDIVLPCLDLPAATARSLLELGANAVTVMPWPHPARMATSTQAKLDFLQQYALQALPIIRCDTLP
jgi:probable F420-dependent oxidoreductase